MRKQIGVIPYKFETIKELNRFLTEQITRDQQYFRQMARVGITPDNQILVEIADASLTIGNKDGNTVRVLAPPTEMCHSWLSIVQQSGRRVLVEAGNPSGFEGSTMRVALVRTIVNAFAGQTDRIVFAPGDSAEQDAWYADGGSLIRLTTTRMHNIVAIPKGLGNGLLALSVLTSKASTLYRLPANNVKTGQFSAERWEPVINLDGSIQAIERRFRDQHLIVAMSSGQLVVLDCTAIKHGQVVVVRRTEDAYQASPAADIGGNVGLFVGKNGSAPEALFGAVDVYGLPTAPAKAFQAAAQA